MNDFQKYSGIVPTRILTESDLALSFVECMNKIWGAPQIIKTDCEGGFAKKLISKYLVQNNVTYIPTKGSPHMYERMLQNI